MKAKRQIGVKLLGSIVHENGLWPWAEIESEGDRFRIVVSPDFTRLCFTTLPEKGDQYIKGPQIWDQGILDLLASRPWFDLDMVKAELKSQLSKHTN